MNEQDAFVGYHLSQIEMRLDRLEATLRVLLQRSSAGDAALGVLTAKLETSTTALADAVATNQPDSPSTP